MSLKKLHYYSVHTLLRMLPNVLHRTYARTLLSQFDKMSYAEQSELMARVHYYCQLQHPFPLDHDSRVSVRHFRKTGGNTYFFDLRKIIKGFCPDLEFCFINGDVTHVPPTPCFVKSRPIEGNRSNSVLLKLNAVRHYQFVDDPLPFDKKKDNLVWRGMGFGRTVKRLSSSISNTLCATFPAVTITKHTQQAMWPRLARLCLSESS
ncbi:hypothetical protein [Vibrio navarrensis]|uniref:hypothetical protein n=1 Tax=Vibrio navarrensis TaxID=29495 RepID=UPI0033904FEA